MIQYSIRNIKPKKRKQTMHYLTIKEKKEVILECGDAALIMYEFYISKGGAKDYQFIDSKTSAALGWDISKAKRIRLKLEKHKYVKTLTFSNKKGKYVVTYIGKENTSGTDGKGFIHSEISENNMIVSNEECEVLIDTEEQKKIDNDDPFS